jgi:hypothetical protein
LILIIDDYLFLAGGLIAVAWGMAHFFLRRPAVSRFWTVEGLALAIAGAAVIFTVAQYGTENTGVRVVTWLAASVTLALGVFNLMNGLKTGTLQARLGGVLGLVSGALLVAGSIINS